MMESNSGEMTKQWIKTPCAPWFAVKLWHGGKFVKKKDMEYIGGRRTMMKNCTLDAWSLQEIISVLKSFGYKGTVKIFYKQPELPLDCGLHEIQNDQECMTVGEIAMSLCVREVEMYITHGCNKGDGVLLTLPNESKEVQGGVRQHFSHENVEEMNDVDVNSEHSFFEGGDELFASLPLDDNVTGKQLDASNDKGKEVEHTENIVDSEEDSDDDSMKSIRFSDSEEDDDDCFSKYVDEDVEDSLMQKTAVAGGSTADTSVTLQVEEMGDIDSEYESEGLQTNDGESNNEDGKKNDVLYVKYNPKEMCKSFQFKLGMEFTSIAEFKGACREWSLLNGYGIWFEKNDLVRCRAKCREGCAWRALVSKVGGSLTYRMKRLYNKHSCGLTFNSNMASSKWIASKIVGEMKTHGNIKLCEVINFIRKNYMAEISITKAYWARRLAREQIQGSYAEQYKRLWDYYEEVKRANPGTTFELMTERPKPEEPPKFVRLYMCLDAVKQGFLNACRPIIGIDGCFLKGPFGGVLLVAVGRDPNDQYFPIAVAAVESETKDSWIWFMKLLFDDIGHITNRGLVFISDQQKGLVPAFEELGLQEVEHRYCVRHIYANVKKRYGGGTILRDLVLAAAKASYFHEWERKMAEVYHVSSEAYNYLMEHNPKMWARSHFSIYPKCDMIMNNISESFNGRILEARDLPIISMFEWIRGYVMERFAKNRLMVQKYRGKGKICPKPRKRLDKQIKEVGKWVQRWAGNEKFEVTRWAGTEKYTVDLQERSCTCRFWGLTGLPCQHACSCIFFKKEDPQDYVSYYYKIESYLACYSPILNPINGDNMWTVTNAGPLDPPSFRKQPGRPRMLRRREPDGNSKRTDPNKLKRAGTSLRCSNCNYYGHNKRRYTQPSQTSSVRGRGNGSQASSTRGRGRGNGSEPQHQPVSSPATPQPAFANVAASQPQPAFANVAASQSQPTFANAAASQLVSSTATSRGRGRGRGKTLELTRTTFKWKGNPCVTRQKLQVVARGRHVQCSQESVNATQPPKSNH